MSKTLATEPRTTIRTWAKESFTASTINPKHLKVGKWHRQRTVGSIYVYTLALILAGTTFFATPLDPVVTFFILAAGGALGYLLNDKVFGREYRKFRVEDIYVIEDRRIVSFGNGTTGTVIINKDQPCRMNYGAEKSVRLYGLF